MQRVIEMMCVLFLLMMIASAWAEIVRIAG